MGVLIGTMSLGQAMPNLEFISTARGAAAAVWEIIDLVIPTLGVIFHQWSYTHHWFSRMVTA